MLMPSVDLVKLIVQVSPDRTINHYDNLRPLTWGELLANTSGFFPYQGDSFFYDNIPAFALGAKSPVLPASCAFGIPYSLSARDVQSVKLTDKIDTWRYSPEADWQRYGALLPLLMPIVQGGTISHLPGREKECLNLKVEGLVRDRSWDNPYIGVGPTSRPYGHGHPDHWFQNDIILRGQPYNKVTASYDSPTGDHLHWRETILSSDLPPASEMVDLPSYMEYKLNHIGKGGSYSRYWDGVSLRATWTLLDYTIQSVPGYVGELRMDNAYKRITSTHTYQVFWCSSDTGIPYYESCVWTVETDIAFIWMGASGSQDPYGLVNPSSSVLLVVDNSKVIPGQSSDGWWGDTKNFFRIVNSNRNSGLVAPILHADESSDTHFQEFFHSYNGQFLRKDYALRRAFDRDSRELRPSSFLAACDALDSNVEILKANHLQNLQHLKDVLSLIPDVGKLGEVTARLAKGDFTAIPLAIDAITELILQWRFQQSPLLSAYQELAPIDVRKRISDLLAPQTYTWRGKFVYQFEDDNLMVDGKLSLVTRCKINLSFDASTALPAILAANSVGLLPNLSRLWSLVPFSFVVDWFTNESARLKAVDNQILFATAFRVHYCVYSYELTWLIDEKELAFHNLVNLDEADPLRITLYEREVSRYMPCLRNSKHDFLRRKHGPDPITVGSLLFQLLS